MNNNDAEKTVKKAFSDDLLSNIPDTVNWTGKYSKLPVSKSPSHDFYVNFYEKALVDDMKVVRRCSKYGYGLLRLLLTTGDSFRALETLMYQMLTSKHQPDLTLARSVVYELPDITALSQHRCFNQKRLRLIIFQISQVFAKFYFLHSKLRFHPLERDCFYVTSDPSGSLDSETDAVGMCRDSRNLIKNLVKNPSHYNPFSPGVPGVGEI